MSPEYMRPHVKAQKNDDHDAEAIAEAAIRPTMRFVEIKTEEQLDVQTLHRVRDRPVGQRTSLTNQIRSLLLERGHIVAQGHARLRLLLGELLDSGVDALSPRMAFLLGDMRTPWEGLNRRIAAFDAEFAAMARTEDPARRLTGIPGIGPLNATALVAAVCNAATFAKGRDGAWLGLLPISRRRTGCEDGEPSGRCFITDGATRPCQRRRPEAHRTRIRLKPAYCGDVRRTNPWPPLTLPGV